MVIIHHSIEQERAASFPCPVVWLSGNAKRDPSEIKYTDKRSAPTPQTVTVLASLDS